VNRRIFVTATDTGAGKTWVTTAAVTAWRAAGIDAVALKPVACGLSDDGGINEDVQSLMQAQAMHDPDAISLYRFALPASPARAAAEEGLCVEPERLLQWCGDHAADVCLIEGIGGLMVPLTDNWLVSDWIAWMPACEVWLVVGCRLGVINHTLLTLEKLKAMGRQPAAIILNASCEADEAWLQPTYDALLPWLESSCSITMLRHGETLSPAVPR